MPTRFGVQFQLVWFCYAQRRAGHPRSSPSPPFGGVCEYQNVSRSFGGTRASLAPTTSAFFGLGR
ncbi:MAG: hypothetical protein LBQ66_01675 [Planctomycetaceae bacterium]|nr:hypothetical protein [Planctomycetaceae bacterium]